MLWLLPQHLIHTTRQLLHILKLLVGCFFLDFVWFSASLYQMCKCVPWLLSGPLTHVESPDGASEDAVATTPAPNPHNQTTSEVTGRVFLFSVCVVFCKFGFCIKCLSVSLGFSLAPSLMWNTKMEPVKMLWTATVMMCLSPQHPIPTTRPHLPILKLVVRFPFNDIYGFC